MKHINHYRYSCVYSTNRPIEIHRCSDAVTNSHTHDFYEFSIVSKGIITHIINGQKIQLDARKLLLIKPENVHEIQQEEKATAEAINISITTNQMKQFFDFYEIDIDMFFKDKNNGIACNLIPEQHELLLELIKETEKRSYINEENLSVYEKMLLSELFKVVFKDCYVSKSTNPEWIDKIIIAMNNPKNFELKISDFYKMSSYGKTQCTRLFANYTGMSPIKYFNKCKIDYSCILLDMSDYNILHIAEELGYYSLSHFNHSFLKEKGVTPSQYRKRNRLKG